MNIKIKKQDDSLGGAVQEEQPTLPKKLSEVQLRAIQDTLEAEMETIANKKIALDKKEKKLNQENEQLALSQKEFFLIQEKEKQASDRNEKYLCQEKESLFKREKDLIEKGIKLDEKEIEASLGFPKKLESLFLGYKLKVDAQNAHNLEAWDEIEKERNALLERDLLIKKYEVIMNNGFVAKKSELEKELAEQKSTALKAMENTLHDIREREMVLLQQKIDHRLEQFNVSVQKEKEAFEGQKKDLQIKQATLDQLQDDLAYTQQRQLSRKESLDNREQHIVNEVEKEISESRRLFEYEKAMLMEENTRLIESITRSTLAISHYEELERRLGGRDAAVVLLELETHVEEISSLREKLATRPTMAMKEAYKRMEKERAALELQVNQLSDKISKMNEQIRNIGENEIEMAIMTDKISALQIRNDTIIDVNEKLKCDLKRLQISSEIVQERDERIKEIERPYIQTKKNSLTISATNKVIKEVDWLHNISVSCEDFGLKFPKRILYAFHTALKTSEWSPLTILSGVSGTGKSELPRLYSHFGGINFLSLPVQPNWDSQESMLGYFNAIDNKFDAQPILRFLAQSQKLGTEEYPLGSKNAINLVLLDEMNLAHIELYFAEFLSKLELRRSMKGDDVPNLELKLGLHMEPYNLPLGRNMLWAGTMNQDETTKSLSDKVLDRGILITFPRPTKFQRRTELKPLGAEAPLLHRGTWESWWCKKSEFTQKQISPYMKFVEEMNTSLSKVGKALGHRVWQSIEYYMANYPDVLEAQRYLQNNNHDEGKLDKAMKIAFEDQIVQKVMPKLRGIETRGKSKTDCLDKIKEQLVKGEYAIIDDFDIACEFGYGQFMWNSANYIKNFESEIDLSQPEE